VIHYWPLGGTWCCRLQVTYMLSGSLSKDYADDRANKILCNAANKILVNAALQLQKTLDNLHIFRTWWIQDVRTVQMRVSVLCLGDSLDQVCGSGTGALLICTRYVGRVQTHCWYAPGTQSVRPQRELLVPRTLPLHWDILYVLQIDTSLRNVGYATHFRTVHHRHNRAPLESSPCWKFVVLVTFKGLWRGWDG